MDRHFPLYLVIFLKYVHLTYFGISRQSAFFSDLFSSPSLYIKAALKIINVVNKYKLSEHRRKLGNYNY